MKWLETIKVQTAIVQEHVVQDNLISLTEEVRNSSDLAGLQGVKPYQHGMMSGYFVIQLFWDTETPLKQASMLGLQLKQTLRTFGLVDHTVWIEQM